MSCSAGAVLQYDVTQNSNSAFRIIYSIPRRINNNLTFRAGFNDIIDRLKTDQISGLIDDLPIIEADHEGSFYHILQLPKFGFLLLNKSKSPLAHPIVRSLLPLNQKLARACRACSLNAFSACFRSVIS